MAKTITVSFSRTYDVQIENEGSVKETIVETFRAQKELNDQAMIEARKLFMSEFEFLCGNEDEFSAKIVV